MSEVGARTGNGPTDLDHVLSVVTKMDKKRCAGNFVHIVIVSIILGVGMQSHVDSRHVDNARRRINKIELGINKKRAKRR
jgi:hypothetical protein